MFAHHDDPDRQHEPHRTVGHQPNHERLAPVHAAGHFPAPLPASAQRIVNDYRGWHIGNLSRLARELLPASDWTFDLSREIVVFGIVSVVSHGLPRFRIATARASRLAAASIGVSPYPVKVSIAAKSAGQGR